MQNLLFDNLEQEKKSMLKGYLAEQETPVIVQITSPDSFILLTDKRVIKKQYGEFKAVKWEDVKGIEGGTESPLDAGKIFLGIIPETHEFTYRADTLFSHNALIHIMGLLQRFYKASNNHN